MKRRIFFSMSIIALLSAVICSVLACVVIYSGYEDEMKRLVVSEAKAIGSAVELYGEDYLKSAETAAERVTLIKSDGTVLFDNFANETAMENHLDREEVREALSGGIGEALRSSDTLSEKTYYYAIRLNDGSVLRVSEKLDTVFKQLMALMPWIVAIVVFVIVLSVAAAKGLTELLIRPINDMDPDDDSTYPEYDELAVMTARLRAQKSQIELQMKKLSENQREFAEITDNMREGFVVVDRSFEMLSYNKSALEILGAQPDGAQGRSILAYNRSEGLRQAVYSAVGGSADERRIQIGARVYDIIASPVQTGDRTGGAVIVMMDVTDRAESERMRREFSANVSHELKTPLTSISGYAEIMKNGLVKPEDMRSFAEKIYSEAARLVTLIDDTIKLSGLDEGSITAEPEDVDLTKLAQTVAAQLAPLAQKSGVTVSVSGDHAVIRAVRRMLVDLVFNLCENAVKYNKKGGKVDITVAKEADKVKLCVSDTGIGIGDEDIDRVFERFYRADKSRTDRSGTGLGLSIVKHAAAYLGASVTVQSKLGEGSTFTVVFQNQH